MREEKGPLRRRGGDGPATAVRSAKRVRLDPDLRRERVLAAATRLFERHPYDKLTTQRLAESCEISEGLIYHYFGSKRGLYVACLERSIAEFVGSIRDPGPDLPIEERLRHAMDNYLDFVERYPRSYGAVLRGGVGTDPEVYALTERARGQFGELIVRGLGLDASSPSLALAVRGWMGFVEAACTRWLDLREVERDELRELLVQTARATFSPAPTA